MSSSNFGTITTGQSTGWSRATAKSMQEVHKQLAWEALTRKSWFSPYPPGWRLGAIRRRVKRKGKPARVYTKYLLWIDGVQMGPFRTHAERRRFMQMTMELQNASDSSV